MDIFYKHKETGYIISLKELKEIKQRDYCFSINYPIETINLEKDLVFKTKMATYLISEIPFSEDFEIVLKEDTFSREEIIYILRLLNEDYSLNNKAKIELKNKFLKLFRGLEEREFRYGY